MFLGVKYYYTVKLVYAGTLSWWYESWFSNLSADFQRTSSLRRSRTSR